MTGFQLYNQWMFICHKSRSSNISYDKQKTIQDWKCYISVEEAQNWYALANFVNQKIQEAIDSALGQV